MEAGSSLLVCGALVGVLLVLRVACLHVVDQEGLPTAIRGRIRRGDRLQPYVFAAVLVVVAAGLVLSASSR